MDAACKQNRINAPSTAVQVVFPKSFYFILYKYKPLIIKSLIFHIKYKAYLASLSGGDKG